MKARFQKLRTILGDTFWLLPGVLVLAGILLAVALVSLDRGGFVPRWLIDSPWLYNGGATGARTLLGAVASSTIGVAGTVFSITIAALSLAAGQMGPRLLRNFTRDRGNQMTLGAFLGTFSYALMVLRSVRTHDEGDFVPHLSLSVGITLAFVCVATLVYFVGHMAGRINVDTVIDLVSEDTRLALRRLMCAAPQPAPPGNDFWAGACVVTDARRGYLQHLDRDGLANWGSSAGVSLRLLARPGDYVFPGAPIALVKPAAKGAEAAIRSATAVGPHRVGAEDLEFSIRQLVEVAVRALSPGINDPHTAMSVLDRLAAALCDAVPLHLASGVTERNGRAVLVVPAVTYSSLTDTMFHMVRQNAAGSAAVLIHTLQVLTSVAGCERVPTRLAELRRHADLVLADAEQNLSATADLDDVRRHHGRFSSVAAHGVVGVMMTGDRSSDSLTERKYVLF